MVRIVHISDLHFGTVVPVLVEPLLKAINELDPRIVVISGDLTQRAREWQYAEAALFLKRIGKPTLAVPGNHDVPLWNLYNRFFKPLDLYRKYISENLEPEYQDAQIIILGINTARSFVWKEGGISEEQMLRMETRLNSAPLELFKAVVMHHPIVPLERAPGIAMVGRAAQALAVLERAGAGLIMAGHGHDSYVAKSTAQFGQIWSSILVVHAGTTLSNRTRGTLNAFNMLDIHSRTVELIPYEWDKKTGAFVPRRRRSYENLGLSPIGIPDLVIQPAAQEVRESSETGSEKL